MNRSKKEYDLINNIINNDCLVIIDNAIPSLKVSIELERNLSSRSKHDLIQIIKLIEDRYEILKNYIEYSVNKYK